MSNQTSQNQTRAQREIQEHQKAIEKIQERGFVEDIVDVLKNKNYTQEELENACRAFLKHVDYKKRLANIKKAIKKRDENKQAESAPTS